jgi:hypothetical protein
MAGGGSLRAEQEMLGKVIEQLTPASSINS